jgi:hypothetical protein
VSYTPSGDEGPTVYIQTKERKKKRKKTVPRADKKKSRWVVKYSAVYVESKNTFRFAQPSGCRNGKNPMGCKYAVVQSSGAHNFYWVSTVHIILPSFTLPRPPQATERKNKNKNKLFHVQIKKKSRWVHIIFIGFL